MIKNYFDLNSQKYYILTASGKTDDTGILNKLEN